MNRIMQKKGWLGLLLSVFMGALVTTAVITTVSSCVVCRDCGPKRAFPR